MIGIFNPLVDRTPAGEWFGIPVTRGIISFISIILRCMLTILGAFTLLASTGFAPLCRGLRQLGAPRILITLLAFLYRYAFILMDEFQNMLMAFRSRRGGSGSVPLSTWGAMTGQLLLRTFGRAERIYQAVLCRGGEDPEFVSAPGVITMRGVAGGILFCALVILFRCFNVTMLAGQCARSLLS